MTTSTIDGTGPAASRGADGRLLRLIKRAYWPVLIPLAVLGLAAIAYRLHAGLKITAMTSDVSWGLWVALFIYFVGMSAGAFLLSSLIYVFGMRAYARLGRLALLSAVIALGGGMLMIWIDLGHPMRVYAIFTRAGWASMMKIESWLYLVYVLLCLGELWLLMRGDLARQARAAKGIAASAYRALSLGYSPPLAPREDAADEARALRRVAILGTIGVPVAIAVHGGTGAIFAVVMAKPYWFSGLTPIIFLVSALLSGSGLITFLYACFGRRDGDAGNNLRGLANLMALFVCLDLLLVGAEFLVGYYGAIPDHTEILNSILFGSNWYLFWIGQLGLAAIVPLALVSLRRSRRSPLWMGMAGLAIVVGMVAVRLNLVVPAYLRPPFSGFELAYMEDRLGYSYFPSFWEWTTSAGVIVLVILLFSMAFRWLPIFPGQQADAKERTTQ